MDEGNAQLIGSVLAVDAGLDTSVLKAVLSSLGQPNALEDAIDDGRVAVVHGVVVASHPVEVADLRASERRSIHGAIAEALRGDGPRAQRVRRANHLAAATVLPDEDVAYELEAIAAELRLEDAVADSVVYWRQAAALSPSLTDRARRLRGAGEALWLLSRTDEAGLVLLEGFAATDDPKVRADIAIALGQIELWTRGPRHGLAILVPSADAVADVDPDRAAALLVHASNTVVISLDVEAGVRFARRALELAQQGTGAVLPAAQVALAVALAFRGETAESLALIGPLEQLAWSLLEADSDAIPELEHLLNVLGFLATMTERWERGEAYLERVVFRARSAGSTSMLAAASAILTELRFRSGRFAEASELLPPEVIEMLPELEVGRSALSDRPGPRPDAVIRVWRTAVGLRYAAVTCPLASIGRVRDHALSSLREAEHLDAPTPIAFFEHTLALLAISEGDFAGAAAHLDRIAAIAASGDVHEPGMLWWQVDHIESLHRCGRLHEAHSALDRLSADADRTQRRSAHAAVARSRALFATSSDEMERAAQESLDLWIGLPAPFEAARTLVVRGRMRLSFGDHDGARRDADEAAAVFERLGAHPWAAVAKALVATIGDATDPLASLTEAELRVVQAVTNGLRNRDVAALLVVSERTIESHLQRIYRKLGVANRTQLANLRQRN